MADFFENIAPRVGVTADQFARLSGPEALHLYLDSLERAGVSQQEMTFYLEAMAWDATRLIPLLQNGGAEMTRLGAQAQALGAVLDSDAIAAMRRSELALVSIGQVFTGVRNRSAVALAPSLEAVANAFVALASSTSPIAQAFDAVLACPEMIPPSEWLPEVWGETGDAQFADQKAAEETIGAVMGPYNSVAGTMTRSLWIEPIYEVDPNSDETLWEPWVDGFTHAMRLPPEAWENLLDLADDETRATMIFMMALQDIYTGNSKFTDDEIDEIDLEAPDLIPNCVATILHQSRPELAGAVRFLPMV
jgi:uncharacterized protein